MIKKTNNDKTFDNFLAGKQILLQGMLHVRKSKLKAKKRHSPNQEITRSCVFDEHHQQRRTVHLRHMHESAPLSVAGQQRDLKVWIPR